MLQDKQETNGFRAFCWDESSDKRLMQMRSQGYTFPRIAEILGVPSAKVACRRHETLRKRNPEGPPRAAPLVRPVTDEDKALFRQLYELEPALPMEEIGRRLGRTKNAACGLRKRLGLRPRRREPPRGYRQDGKPIAPKRIVDSTQHKAALWALDQATDQGFVNGGKAFAALTPHCCRFIKGDPKHGEHSFCGSRVKPGKSWCPYHYTVVFRDVV